MWGGCGGGVRWELQLRGGGGGVKFFFSMDQLCCDYLLLYVDTGALSYEGNRNWGGAEIFFLVWTNLAVIIC